MVLLLQLIGILYLIMFLMSGKGTFVKTDLVDFTDGVVEVDEDCFDVIKKDMDDYIKNLPNLHRLNNISLDLTCA